MSVRPVLGAASRGILAAALVLTLTELMTAPPAHADPAVILESPPTTVGGGGNVLIVQTPDVTIPGTITVDNPGSSVPTGQQCAAVSPQYGSFCLGTPDDLANVHVGPIDLDDVEASPYRLPGHAMDWIVDEAVAFVAATHGVENDDLIRAFARPEVRAYVVARLESIVNKKLYGEPMDFREKAAYDDLEAIYKDKLVSDSKWALEEYNKWTRNPCGYVAPPPPSSKFDAIPNVAASSTLCSSAGSRFSVWKISEGTPPADTFDRWASYRHPTPGMKNLSVPQYQYAVTQGLGAGVLLKGYGIAAVAGLAITLGLIGMAEGTATTIAGVLGFASLGTGGVTGALTLSLALSVGGLVFILVGALVTLGVAIWQMVEDAKPGADLTDRSTRAAANNDPFGMTASIAKYAALDYATLEDPANPDDLATIHKDAFHQQLFSLVNDWQLFRIDGTFIPDPTTGYNPLGSVADTDVHFVEGGIPQNAIVVRAPEDTVNEQGQELSGYLVSISRGYLMVRDLVLGEGAFRDAVPRLSLRYRDDQGELAFMSILRVGQVDGPPKRQFLLATVGDDDEMEYVASDSWTFDPGLGQPLKTVTLVDQAVPVTPVVNVIPSVEGDLVADHFVKLSANLSTPGQSTANGQFFWSVQRLDELGNPVGTPFNPGGNLSAFTHRFTEPGDYRAKVTYTWTGDPSPGAASGTVDFSMIRPGADVMSAEIEDDRVADGSLSLKLRLSQNTRGDQPADPAEFEVAVDWADDGLGNVVTRHYAVRCLDTGFDTCETGPIPDTGPPTNAQWSEAPTFKVADDQNYLPHVKVTVTNSFGETISRIYEITGEHRPTYATLTPYAEMPAGMFSEVDVVEVFPSDLLPGSKSLQINPYVLEMVEHLPPGVIPDIEQRPDDTWWLQLQGVPTADDIGQWAFYFPFEQETLDNPRRPTPALATLEVVSSTTPGYRGILRNVPQNLSDRTYRTEYPNWMVQVAQRLDEGEGFADFTGTAMCKLEAGPNVVFDQPCAQNAPFPWPDELISDSLLASVRAMPGGQPVSGDGAYEAQLFTQFLEPTVTVDPVGAGDSNVTVRLYLEDNAQLPRVIAPPFSAKGFTVSCSLDGAAYVLCLDSGVETFAKTPLGHALDVKVVASDAATVVRRVTWDGGPVPPAPPAAKQLSAALTAVPAAAKAMKARFELAVGYGGDVAPPYAGKGFAVTCVMDGAKPVPCFDDGTLELLRVPGKHQLAATVKATDGQTVTQQVAWSVGTPPAKLKVGVPDQAEQGTKVKLKARGLLPKEKFVIKAGKVKLAKGLANDLGRVVKKVKLTNELGLGKVKVVVRGATEKRVGNDVVKVVAAPNRMLDPRLAGIVV